MNRNIVAIVVTYQPDINVLTELMNALKNQVDSIIMVDNGSGIDISSYFSKESHDPFPFLTWVKTWGWDTRKTSASKKP